MKNDLSIREIQDILLHMYEIIDEICRRHNLRLFATGGTVLGAVRHKGFIPWDDDMDVALSREDYEKFVEIAQDELPDYINLVWMKRPNHYRVMDSRYPIELNGMYKEFINEGETACIAIDIQPFDGMPNNFFLRYLHCVRVLAQRVIYKMCSPNKIYDASWRKKWEKVMIAVLKKISFLFSNEEAAQEKFNLLCKKYTYKNSHYIADYVGKYKFKDIYPKDWWEPGIIVPFENVNMRIPSQYDKYLIGIYGDYMKIPKQNEQDMHRKVSVGE